MYDVNIYPNPANDFINLQAKCLQTDCKIEGSLTIEVTNLLGEDCLSGKLDNNGIVDISKFPNGVYQILIKFDDGNTIVKQFVKQ